MPRLATASHSRGTSDLTNQYCGPSVGAGHAGDVPVVIHDGRHPILRCSGFCSQADSRDRGVLAVQFISSVPLKHFLWLLFSHGCRELGNEIAWHNHLIRGEHSGCAANLLGSSLLRLPLGGSWRHPPPVLGAPWCGRTGQTLTGWLRCLCQPFNTAPIL